MKYRFYWHFMVFVKIKKVIKPRFDFFEILTIIVSLTIYNYGKRKIY